MRCASGTPKDLTLVVNSATHRYSLTHELIEAGLVRKVICSAARGHSKELIRVRETVDRQARSSSICCLRARSTECIRAGGAGIPAFYTPSASAPS